MTQINLLPWREQARKKRQNRFGIIALVAAGLGIFFAVFFHLDYAFRISEQNKRNVTLQTALDEESTHLTSLNKQKKELLDVDNQLHFIYSLRTNGYQAIRLLNQMAELSPESITLSKIVRIGSTISIAGSAKSNMQITLFMESIEKSKYFHQPVLNEIHGKQNDTGEERSFELKLEQADYQP